MRNHILQKIITIVSVLFLYGNIGWTQNSLKGKVVDEDNEPLIGANILQKGTATGTITDLDGNYELSNLPAGPITLQFSYTGFQEVSKIVNCV